MTVSPDVLAACIDDVRSGRVSVDDCVASHPLVEVELRCILEVATSIVPPTFPPMDSVARARGRASLMAALANDTPVATKFVGERYLRTMLAAVMQSGTFTKIERVSPLFIASVLVATVALGGGAVAAAGEALPGDALYPIKLTVEEVQLTTLRGDEAKARYSLRKAADRVTEIDRASELGREDAIATAAASYIQDLADANRYLSQANASGHDVQAETDGLNGELARQRVALEDAKRRTPPGAQAVVSAAEHAARVGISVPSSAGGTTISETATPAGMGGKTTSPLTMPTLIASETPNAKSTPKPTPSVQSTTAPQPSELDNNQTRGPSETPRPSGDHSDAAGPKSLRRSDFDDFGEDRRRNPARILSPASVPTSAARPTPKPEPTEIRRPSPTPQPSQGDRSPPARATRHPEPTEGLDPRPSFHEPDHRRPPPTAVPKAKPKQSQNAGSDDHGGESDNDH